MKYTYEIITGKGFSSVKRTDEAGVNSFIPIDEFNSDYQRYLRWLENPEAEENGTIS